MQLSETRCLTDRFNEEDGRRPRLLLASLGEAADERGLRLYAAAYADAGFDIDVCPLKQSAADTARMAAENDVHAIGLCGLLAHEEGLLHGIQSELVALERGDIACFVRLPEGANWDVDACLTSFPSQNEAYDEEAHALINELMAAYL